MPLVTPLLADGRIDERAVGRIVDRVVEAGCHPFVLGTTGEGASVGVAMGETLVGQAVQCVAGRARVYAGISTNSLDFAAETGRRYHELGADVVVVHPPCYFEASGEGLREYFERLADRLSGPMLLYNIPLTTRLSIPLDVVEALSHHPNIVGLKDSEGDRDRLRAGLERWGGRDDFAHLVGAAQDGAFGVALGADGIVPGGANLTPSLHRRLYDAAMAGDSATAAELQETADRLDSLYFHDRPLVDAIAALKVLMAEAGLCEPHVLPPLTRLPAAEEARVREGWRAFSRELVPASSSGGGRRRDG